MAMGVHPRRTTSIARVRTALIEPGGVLRGVGISPEVGEADMSNGLQQYKRIFAERNATRRTLDRGSIPTPAQYLSHRGLLKSKPRGEWAAISCPVHKGGSESNPSLRVSLVDGHFKCMACGAAGGDVVALHRIIAGVGFMDAVRELGGRFDE